MYGGKPKPNRPHHGPAQLNERQAKFVAAYLECGNATQAYRAAGYSQKEGQDGARAGQVMKAPAVRAAIEKARQKVIAKGIYGLEQAHKEISELLAISIEKGQMTAAAKLVETKAKLHGLLIEKHDVRTAGAFSIVINALPVPQKLDPAPIQIESKDVTSE